MQQIQEYDRMKIAMLNVDLRKDDEEKKLYTTSRWYWHFHLSGIVWLCALTLYMSISCHVPASFFLVVQVGFGFSENRRSNYWDMQHRAHGVKSIKSQSKSSIRIQNSIFDPSFLHGYSACRRRASDQTSDPGIRKRFNIVISESEKEEWIWEKTYCQILKTSSNPSFPHDHDARRHSTSDQTLDPGEISIL